jgi:hypothetical protein
MFTMAVWLVGANLKCVVLASQACVHLGGRRHTHPVPSVLVNQQLHQREKVKTRRSVSLVSLNMYRINMKKVTTMIKMYTKYSLLSRISLLHFLFYVVLEVLCRI